MDFGTMEQTTYTARWIFPVASPPLEGGTLTLAGDKIVAVELHGTRTPDVDLGNFAILPGFVNTHTHLDLTGARGVCPPTPDFTQWLRQVIAFRRGRTPEVVQTNITAGIAECLRYGTTLIGDIAAGGASQPFLVKANTYSVVFYELLGLSRDRARQASEIAMDWLDPHAVREKCTAGVSPHAPYSAHRTLFRDFHGWPIPIATHLAETQAELELLRSHSGPFVDFLRELNAWDPSGLIAEPRDVTDNSACGIFVHCNYLDPATPFRPTQTVVVCPRTHEAFGHPHHPFPQMNVRVALGTDSLASNPDLDILAEARFLRRYYPEVESAMLLRMLTLSGAEALGFDDITGCLAPGKSADLVVLPLPNTTPADPHDLVLDSTLPVARVMFRGEWIR
jgi:cytosine/adenosine deaminase-related metal-dependent hydrolase